jgi:hypothetical protein
MEHIKQGGTMPLQSGAAAAMPLAISSEMCRNHRTCLLLLMGHSWDLFFRAGSCLPQLFLQGGAAVLY